MYFKTCIWTDRLMIVVLHHYYRAGGTVVLRGVGGALEDQFTLFQAARVDYAPYITTWIFRPSYGP